jgi:prepilin-type N-terminal cleavage/methylation domain-containing protein
MKCRSEKIVTSDLRLSLQRRSAFTMPEVMAALIILAMVCSSVFVVIDRSMESLADSSLKMQAFETARENMEVLLASDSVSEKTEYGTSDKYPAIQWETTVETFYEPITTRMWIQAVCSAEYIDSQGEVQTVELTHWLTDLSKQQLIALMDRMQEEELEDQQVVETIEEAADYAGVDVETIEQWLENGMQTTEDGFFIMSELDLYQQTDGNPTPEDRARIVSERKTRQERQGPDGTGETDGQPGLPDLSSMTFEELLKFFLERFSQ